ncbi:MFS transporter [Bryobacterales bacterium F-183]|nr:MFS transporter [Bryobacterales bacterium F-183]
MRFHYAWVIAATTFLVLLCTAGVRSAPSVMMVPLEAEFGWSRASISAAVAVNIALFGMIGPFAASWIDRFGLRRMVSAALLLLAASAALSTQMREQWHLMLIWGVLVGIGTGFTSMVLAAIVANRWFDERRGLVTGALSAANATGQLVFLPFLAQAVQSTGWRAGVLLVAALAAVLFVIAAICLRDSPAAMGIAAYGWKAERPVSTAKPMAPFAALRFAAGRPAFWVLAGSFFVCGASTNGLIGTHLIPACHDYGIDEVRAAGLLAVMGIFDILGTTASGWLTDRYPSRYLLMTYYALRGLSLLFLPATLAQGGKALAWFAIFYGLDWIATVPPTVRLTADCFGRENTGVIYGWIGASHQLGAALAAVGAGTIRTEFGNYQAAFWVSGALCFATAFVVLLPGRRVLQQRTA